MSRSRHALRCSSVLALALCLLAQLAGSVHSAAVRHVACDEHGGVVELHAGAARIDVRQGPHAIIATSDHETHHAHCDRSATPRGHRSAISPGQANVAVVVAPTSFARARAPLRCRALFRLAPKGSPPADLATV